MASTQNIKPTRSELMELKKKIKLAKSGYNLLKKKRDGLILEFFEILKKVKNLRNEIVADYIIALQKMNMARIIESDLTLKSAAMAISQRPEINVGKKNIMGVVVPKVDDIKLQKKALERGYGIFTSVSVDEAALQYEKVVEKIVKAAEVETSMRKLLIEIEKTKRRVNALEFEVIPRMEKIRAFITLRLEEVERENTFRMKRIKGKAEATEEMPVEVTA
ncbi:TPA: V-type ATP synthase subunit D [Candidatus Woesearchaeota archaeon]|nr:V-type ATP synthase subunit D [Candidatus Woesearchaeota archaeon]